MISILLFHHNLSKYAICGIEISKKQKENKKKLKNQYVQM